MRIKICLVLIGGLFHLVTGKPFMESNFKVHQTGETLGLAHSTANVTSFMMASGEPAGILNVGGTTASFTGSSTVTQQQPSGSSTSIGGELSAQCGGGQLQTLIAGQQAIGLSSVGNCDSIILTHLFNKTKSTGRLQ